MKILLFVSLVLLGFEKPKPLTESQKIDKLIVYIEVLRDSPVFILNGTEYAPKEAAEQLKMQRKKAGPAIKTSKDFIDKIASKSSTSDKPNVLKLRTGKTIPVQDLLNAQLKVIEN